jgi:hypothetical protein
VALVVGTSVAVPAGAQSKFLRQGEQADRPIDAATRQRVVERLAAEVERSYVDGAVAQTLAKQLRDAAARDAWSGVGGSQAFAESLTAALRRTSRDLHFTVFYNADALPEGRGATLPSAGIQDEERRYAVSINYGIESVRRLPGNVGVLDIRELLLGSDARLAAAMELLRDTDALILDLRATRGGRPEIAQQIASYLLPEQPVLLQASWQRETAETTRTWSLAELPGPRYLGRDVFVLTSSRTFSAGEMLAWSLQSLDRATIVGDTTGGGGHGMNFRTLDPHFAAAIPFIKPIDPRGGWEGTGVRPDLATEGDALRAAHLGALRRVAARTADPARKEQLNRMVADLEQGREPSEARPGGGRQIVRR